MEKDKMCCICIMWQCSGLDVEAEIEFDEFDGGVISKCLSFHTSKRADDFCDYFLEVL